MTPTVRVVSTVFIALILAVVLTVGPASAEKKAGPVLVDVTKQAGISFTHNFGDSKLTSILEATGPGCAFLDYDMDGNLDIYAVNGTHLPGINDPYPKGHDAKKELFNHLYRNQGDGTFVDVTAKAGVGDTGFGIGVVVGDYDNDGDPDIFVANYGPNLLYRNSGDGTFSEVAAAAGVRGPDQIKGFTKWSLHGSFFDYDRDGLLDLYVANYLAFDPEYQYFFGPEGFPGPLSYEGQADILYHNNGDGTFSDVSKKAGINNPKGRAMSVGIADVDGDHDPDIFIANDAMENYLFINGGAGTFKDVALVRGVAYGEFGEATSSMAPIFEDFDNDGDFDLFVPDMGYSCLYRNDGEMFMTMSAASGIAAACGQYTSWAPVTLDYDNDGLLDLFVTNGDAHHLYKEEDLLFKNQGKMRFLDVSLDSGDYFTKSEYVGRGAASGDYDNDGDVDIFVANVNGPGILLRNDGGNRNHWLAVRTVGTKSNRDGVGARVMVSAGGVRQVREVKLASGFLSSSDPRVHFGLGKNKSVELQIRWPSGIVQKLGKVTVDQILTVTEPAK